jgi:two-component system, cell cycle sensor histidine kinase and response regulator CckA
MARALTREQWTDRARLDAAGVLAAVLRAAPMAVVGVDLDGSILIWSPGAERIFGWSEGEVVGRPTPIVPDDLWDESRAMLDAVVRRGLIPDVQTRRRRRDGSVIEVSMSSAPISAISGQTTGVLMVMADATERRSLEAQLQGAQRMEAVGRLAGGVAHDFNNILTAITGYADLLAADLPASDPRQSDVAEIRRAADRATRLTRQLLAFGRREAQQTGWLDLNEVITGVLPMLRPLIDEQVELVISGNAELGRVRADAGQIEQILVNLIVNARDAMPHGGRLVVSTANIELDQPFALEHPGARPGAHVRLTVEDTGMGMDAHTLTHLFEPYFTTKEPGRGTGLGLATVYGIVKQSSGYILVDSQLGRGTSVAVYLPRQQMT